MPWPSSKSAAVAAPAAPRTLDAGTGLCIMHHAWKCTSRRRTGSCYCSAHTCAQAGCINVVAGPKATLCQRHQVVAIAPSTTPAAPVAPPRPMHAPAPFGKPHGSHGSHGTHGSPLGTPKPAHSPWQVTSAHEKKKLAARITLGFQTKIDEEDRRVAHAFATLATSPAFRTLMQQETTTGMQLLDVLSSNALMDDLHWSGIARYLEEQMHVYIRRDKNFAAHFCQDLLLFCSAKIDKAQVEFVMFVTKLVVFPLLGPAIAGASAAMSAASGPVAGVLTSEGLSAAKSGAMAGVKKGAEVAMGIDPGKHHAIGQPVAYESSGTVNDIVEYFNKLRASPITFARVMSLLLVQHPALRSSGPGKIVYDHFGPQILLWHKVLDR